MTRACRGGKGAAKVSEHLYRRLRVCQALRDGGRHAERQCLAAPRARFTDARYPSAAAEQRPAGERNVASTRHGERAARYGGLGTRARALQGEQRLRAARRPDRLSARARQGAARGGRTLSFNGAAARGDVARACVRRLCQCVRSTKGHEVGHRHFAVEAFGALRPQKKRHGQRARQDQRGLARGARAALVRLPRFRRRERRAENRQSTGYSLRRRAQPQRKKCPLLRGRRACGHLQRLWPQRDGCGA